MIKHDFLCLCCLDLSSLLLINVIRVVKCRAPDMKKTLQNETEIGVLLLEILLQRWPNSQWCKWVKKNHLWIHWSYVPVWAPTWNESSAFSQQHNGLWEIPHLCQELRTLPCGKAKADLGATWIFSFAFTGSPKKVSKLDSPFSLLCPNLTDRARGGALVS